MKRWIAFAPLAALAALALLFAGYALQRDPQVKPEAMVGKPAPAVTLSTLGGGGDRSLREIQEPHLINIFASWCGPCEIEHPYLMSLRRQGVRIVGVAYKDDPVRTRAFLERLGDPFATVVMDPDGRAGVELGVSGVPETFAVQGGVIVAKHTGPLTPKAADRLVGRLRAR